MMSSKSFFFPSLMLNLFLAAWRLFLNLAEYWLDLLSSKWRQLSPVHSTVASDSPALTATGRNFLSPARRSLQSQRSPGLRPLLQTRVSSMQVSLRRARLMLAARVVISLFLEL